jgi:hypothetical protein
MAQRAATCLVLLVGLVPCAPAQAPAVPVSATAVPSATPPAGVALKTYTVPAGTRILLSLRNEISTRVARPGDPVYFVSDFPVVADGAVVLPAGMYVMGYIDRVQRPGKVKGRAQLQMHFASMIFPNGVEIPIPGSVDSVPGSSGANVKNSEGTVEQSGTKGRDAQTIASTTVAGAGVGSLVGVGTGNVGMGAGIGAGAGAAVGVLTTLFTRGNDIVFSPGAKLEMELSRPVVVQQTQLAGMPAYTGLNLTVPPAAMEQPLTPAPRPNN